MDLLSEIYTANSLTNSERLQLNKLVLRIFSENATAAEKAILQSTSDDKRSTYLTIFQRVMGMPITGSLGNRAQFITALTKLLWTYEKEGVRTNYIVPFPHFKPPRTKEELDALIQSIYPFACKFSPERIEADRYGTQYKNTVHNLESVDTSASFFDCLVHAFLTSMSKCYRQLSNNQRKAFAYFFRRVVCPRYLSISDLLHTELYEQRATLDIEPPDFDLYQKCSTLLNRISEGKVLADLDVNTKSVITASLKEKKVAIEKELLTRNFIKEFEYLEDRHIPVLVDAFKVNVVLINRIGTNLSISVYSKEGSTHNIILYNPGDGHFRGVRRTTDSKFYFENEDVGLVQFVTLESAKTTVLPTTAQRCEYKIGEVVLYNGVEKTIIDLAWSDPDTEGIRYCESVKLNDEKEQGRWGLQLKDIPIAQISKKPAAGGKRTTRKQRRIFLKS